MKLSESEVEILVKSLEESQRKQAYSFLDDIPDEEWEKLLDECEPEDLI